MAKISVLVDTDIFIDYFNTSRFHALFDSSRFTAAVRREDEDLPALLPIES